MYEYMTVSYTYSISDTFTASMINKRTYPKIYSSFLYSACGTSTQSGILGVVTASNSYSSISLQISQRVSQSLTQITGVVNQTIANNFPSVTLVTGSQLTQIQQSKNQTENTNFNNTLQQVLLYFLITVLVHSVLCHFSILFFNSTSTFNITQYTVQ